MNEIAKHEVSKKSGTLENPNRSQNSKSFQLERLPAILGGPTKYGTVNANQGVLGLHPDILNMAMQMRGLQSTSLENNSWTIDHLPNRLAITTVVNEKNEKNTSF